MARVPHCTSSLPLLFALLLAVCPRAFAQSASDAGTSTYQLDLEEQPDPRGDLAWTVFGGTLGLAIAGGAVGLAVAATRCGPEVDSESDRERCQLDGAVYGGFTILNAPFIVSAGVTWAGHASGGHGYYLGTLLGFPFMLPGVALVAVANSPEVEQVLIPLGVATMCFGYVFGAVLGYRIFASVPKSPVQPSIAPTADLRGATFSLTGSF